MKTAMAMAMAHWQWLQYNVYNVSQTVIATTFTYKPFESLVDYYYYPGSNFAILWYVRVLCVLCKTENNNNNRNKNSWENVEKKKT